MKLSRSHIHTEQHFITMNMSTKNRRLVDIKTDSLTKRSVVGFWNILSVALLISHLNRAGIEYDFLLYQQSNSCFCTFFRFNSPRTRAHARTHAPMHYFCSPSLLLVTVNTTIMEMDALLRPARISRRVRFILRKWEEGWMPMKRLWIIQNWFDTDMSSERKSIIKDEERTTEEGADREWLTGTLQWSESLEVVMIPLWCWMRLEQLWYSPWLIDITWEFSCHIPRQHY